MPLTEDEEFELLSLERERALGSNQIQPPEIAKDAGVVGNAGGAKRAFAYGFTGGQIPFGNVVTSGLGAAIAKVASPFTGDERTLRELYDQAQADTKATQEAHQTATLAGNVAGALSTLPAVFSKGGAATLAGAKGETVRKAITGGAEKIGEYAGKVANFSPFAEKGIGTVGNVATRFGGRSVLAAPLAGAYSAGEADSGERVGAFWQGAALGVAASGLIPAGIALGAGGVKGVKKIGEAISPSISDAGASVAKLAKKYNIPMGLDDLTDSAFYKTLISEGKTIPFSNAASKVQNQMRAFTRAVSRTIGADSDRITPDVISKRFDEIGKQFDDFFRGKKIDLGEDFGLGLRQQDFINDVADNYAVDGKSILNKYIGQINSAIQPDGVVDGEALGAVRNRLSKIARTSGNPEISSAARELELFIIDSVADVSEEGAKQALKNAKYQYKNLIAIEPLAQKAQISGEISPSQILGRVRQVYGRAFSKGEAGELGDLANIGQYIKETIPNSGTSQRTLARNVLTGNLGLTPITTMINPVIGGLQAAASVGGALGNRALQARNFDADLLAKALQKYEKSQSAQSPAITQKMAKALGVSRAGFTPSKLSTALKDYAKDESGAVNLGVRAVKTETTEFKKWFGGSKVVDSEGKPLVVYHGTHADIESFKPNDALGGGIFFSPDPREAGVFASAKGGNIVPVYIRAEKVWPHVVRSYNETEVIKKAKALGYDAVRVTDGNGAPINWVVFDEKQIKSIHNRGTFDPKDPKILYGTSALGLGLAGGQKND